MALLTFSPNKPVTKNQKVRKISILAYPWCEVLDISGPYEVFAFASLSLQRGGLTDQPVYLMDVLAEKPGPVTTLSGLEIIATHAYNDSHDDVDTLIIPGGGVDSVLKDATLLNWITMMAPRVRRLASVCSGAFLLAECGLLDNRRATTHWDFCALLKNNYQAIKLEPDKIFIRDDFIYTSGGITSGIDMALAMVEEDWGRELALYVARYLVVFLQRPGGQSQFSAYLTCESSQRPDIRELQAWIIENPAENLQVDELAKRMAMSPRNFARTFLMETGTTPAKFVELARLDAARQYLERGDLSIETVAIKAGFIDSERMRRTFIRHLGVNPLSYRERFSYHPQPEFKKIEISSITARSEQPFLQL